MGFLKIDALWEFPGDLVLRICCFQCHGLGPIPGQETGIPQAVGKLIIKIDALL